MDISLAKINVQPKIRIKSVILKDKNGNIISGDDKDDDRKQAR